ncbi:hypothetical protein [Propionivibrio sp.]|uniref:hypothetical protein n=1 Tax=Propionivibrio sp. TaxID=2212460 RepID=UPI003BF30D14
MDRRKFLHTLSCLGATTALPAMALAGTASSAALSMGTTQFVAPENLLEIADDPLAPRIGVVAIGGAGGSVLSSLLGKLPYLNCSIAIDVDPFALHGVAAVRKVLIGNGITRPDDARSAKLLAIDAKSEIAEAVVDLDIAFVVAGMGGAAGTGIAPVIAAILHEKKIISFGAAITPFDFEGRRRQQIALAGTHALGRRVDAVFTIPNQVLAQASGMERSLSFPLDQATTTFERLYRGVTLPFSESGLVNIDTEGVRSILSKDRYSAIGYGNARGENAAETAALQAIAHPLLGERRLRSASGILVSIEGAPGALQRLGQVNKILNTVRNTIGDADHEQILCCGANRNTALADEFRVTILASGILAEENA